MGNYCSSGQNKKDKDNLSQKSEDSPTYQLVSKGSKNKAKDKDKNYLKEAPLVDPEPTSDISNFNAPNTNNGTISSDATKAAGKALHSALSHHDSTSGTPLTVDAPCELPAVSKCQSLPGNLTSIYGKPSISNRRTENDCKIVLYILTANENESEKTVLKGLYAELQRYCASRGFELLLCDLHEDSENFLDPSSWVDEPIEARGGHHLAAECLSEILRYSNTAYIIPILFLGTSLGSPLLPLTVESQDFAGAIGTTAEGSSERKLLETWYTLDDKAEPMCYRLRTQNVTANENAATELQNLYKTIASTFPKEICDFYLTTVIEQEINNMVFINQDLSKRCIWVHTGALPKLDETSNESAIAVEMNRRLNKIQLELKNQLNEKNLIRIPPTVQMSNEQLANTMKSLIVANIDQIINDHFAKFQIPYCTYGVDRNLLAEIEAVKQHSQYLSQNCANFEIMDKQIKQYIMSPSSEPLVIFGPVGCGKSVLSAKVEHFIHTWLPDCCFILRYARLTAISSSVISLVGSITEQLYYYTHVRPYNGPHTLESYAATLKECIEASKYQVVILIDSLDDALELDDLSWLPTKLNDKIKVIITTATTSTKVDHVDKCEKTDVILWHLKDRISKSNFAHLNQFSDQKWNEVLSYGGGDFFSVNPQLQLPDSWKQCDEKIPLQAKLLWWFAWLGEYNLSDTSLPSTSNKMFQTLETKFGKAIIKYLVSLLIASRDGLRETEINELLKQSKLVDDAKVEKLWTKISWIMGRGPILLQINRVRFMDNRLKNVASTRYADDIKTAHNILYQFYKSQPNEHADAKQKYQWFNQQKFNELPYHAFIVDPSSYAHSLYLTDLDWIQTKLKATKCVQCILNDIYLIDGASRAKFKHLDILQRFLEIFIQSINYDADQFYPLFKHHLTSTIQSGSAIENDAICKKWLQDFDSISTPYLDILNAEIQTNDDAGASDTSAGGYDLITNLGGDGHFVASLSTKRGEIGVWNVPKLEQVRLLKNIPEPTALCPVDNHGAAVLCRREIKIIDLNKGILRVTLKGVMNQKMPYFAYCNDAQHLVCLSRNRMYVNLMNLESGDCITTFKAGEDRFLNSLLVSGDGRILVCGDETQKPFPLLVWHLSQRKLLYDLRIPHHDFITSLSAITHEGSYVCVVTKELNEPAPNFIVVYDLQSGTLFKKWKPSCNTVSLSISQTNACVIAGLEDARILIWDLITGNCKFVLVGHTAPVTLLKLDPTGTILLSADKNGRDRSVRLWELSTGKSIAVYTAAKKINTCEILKHGQYIVLALENEPNLVTLELKNCQINQIATSAGTTDASEQNAIYGDNEFTGKTFQL